MAQFVCLIRRWPKRPIQRTTPKCVFPASTVGLREVAALRDFDAAFVRSGVIFVRSIPPRLSRHVHFALKADMRTLASLCPLSAITGCEQSQQTSVAIRSPRRPVVEDAGARRGQAPWRSSG